MMFSLLRVRRPIGTSPAFLRTDQDISPGAPTRPPMARWSIGLCVVESSYGFR